MRLDAHSISVRGVCWRSIKGEPHDIEGLQESAFLLTIAWPGNSEE
jgi:hypothetical protein